MANEACPVTCHNKWWKSWEQDFVWSCGCAAKCLGGLQRRCDILMQEPFEVWTVVRLSFWLCHAALTLQVVGPTFVLLIWTFTERLWFLSRGPCSLGHWLFAGCLLTGAGHCPLPCHERGAEQMRPLALLVLPHLCLANVNRWWWLLPWEERWVTLGFTFLNTYSLLKKRFLEYGCKKPAISTILKIKGIRNH